ncbi:MAG TPA: hypothetical protein VF661_04940 [Actinomycetales bacterium]
MPSRARARVLGSLFLVVFALYGGGSALVTSASGLRWWGAALIVLNSVAVVCIGLLARPVVAPTHPRSSLAYLAAHVLEGLLIAAGLALVLGDEPATADQVYWVAMTGLGLGSIPFCLALLQARLAPGSSGRGVSSGTPAWLRAGCSSCPASASGCCSRRPAVSSR